MKHDISEIGPCSFECTMGDLESNQTKSWNFWNPDFWRLDLKWSGFKMAMAMLLDIWKLDHSKLDVFVRISNGFWNLSRFKMVRLSDFRSHYKSWPFANWDLFDHLKYGHIWISDPSVQCSGRAFSMLHIIFAVFNTCSIHLIPRWKQAWFAYH